MDEKKSSQGHKMTGGRDMHVLMAGFGLVLVAMLIAIIYTVVTGGRSENRLRDSTNLVQQLIQAYSSIDNSKAVSEGLSSKSDSMVSKDDTGSLASKSNTDSVAIDELYESGRDFLYARNGKNYDPKKAYEYFKEAAALGNKRAEFMKAYIAFFETADIGVDETLSSIGSIGELTEDYYEDNYLLALTYIWTYGVNEDSVNMCEAYIEMANQHFGYEISLDDEDCAPEVSYIMGAYARDMYYDYDLAKEWFEKSASDGDIDAYYVLGSLCFYDLDMQELGNEYYLKGANAGHPIAMFNLGCSYLHGDGIEQNYEKAFEWFEKSANLGHANAMNSLANRYAYGEGVEADYDKALEWYYKGIELGNDNCYNGLGNMYYNGRGVEKDYEKAREYWTKAAQLGNEMAIDNLKLLDEK